MQMMPSRDEAHASPMISVPLVHPAAQNTIVTLDIIREHERPWRLDSTGDSGPGRSRITQQTLVAGDILETIDTLRTIETLETLGIPGH